MMNRGLPSSKTAVTTTVKCNEQYIDCLLIGVQYDRPYILYILWECSQRIHVCCRLFFGLIFSIMHTTLRTNCISIWVFGDYQHVSCIYLNMRLFSFASRSTSIWWSWSFIKLIGLRICITLESYFLVGNSDSKQSIFRRIIYI